MTPLFDVDKTHRNRQQASTRMNEYGFLVQSVESELAHRLATIGQNFASVLINGARTDQFDHLHCIQKIRYINAYLQVCQDDNYTHLSSLNEKFDLIIDSMKLHTINDVKHYLDIIKNHLNPNGTLVASFYGGESLRELRQSLLKAELELYQGAALRIIPMIDINSTVQLLNLIGFKNCIVDHEILTISYTNLYNILTDIKGMGESNPFTEPPQPMSYRLFNKTQEIYQTEYNENNTILKVTVEIIYIKCEI